MIIEKLKTYLNKVQHKLLKNIDIPFYAFYVIV